MEELKIIEPTKNGLYHFKSTDEFSIYYAKHKDEMNEMTTQKLNKQFKIDGYRISRINTHDENGKIRQRGEICLKRITNTSPNERKLLNDEQIEERIKVIEDKINSIINVLNQLDEN